MCPACIGTVTLTVAGVISTGGLATLARLKFRAMAGASIDQTNNHEPTNRNGEEQNGTENRDTN